MAVISNPEQILLDALKARVSSYSNRLVVRFRDGDVLRLVAEEFATRENSSTKLPVFTQYRFELSRQGRKIYVWISLGVFLGLPLSKNGFTQETLMLSVCWATTQSSLISKWDQQKSSWTTWEMVLDVIMCSHQPLLRLVVTVG